MTLTGMTLCSGIGAPEMAAPWVDWALASEIEAFPREVLKYRFGYRDARHSNGAPALWSDFTALRPRHMRRLGVPFPDVIVAGTPCQAFSVAGLRKGLEDDRGNLTIQFVRTCHAIVNARSDGRLVVLWENVPGVLSDRSNAFGAFLGGMVGAMDAIPPPIGTGWGREGMVQGPRARAAWAVLDAQWFGVAQRRRSVFALFDFGGAIDPAAVLFERDGLRGDTPPRREARQGVAPTISARTRGGGGLGTDFDCDGGLIASEHPYSGTVSAKWAKGSGGPAGDEVQNLVAHTLRGAGFDASEDGTGRGTPLVPIAGGHATVAVAILKRAISENPNAGPDGAGFRMDDAAYTLEARSVTQAVAFDIRGRDGGAMPEGPHDTASMRAASGGSSRSYIAMPWAVRRLTPRECERLQGFPDDHTLIPRDRKRALKDLQDEVAYLRAEYPEITDDEALRLAADGPRYKALGNSMAVPVIRWIMNRIRASHINQMEQDQ